MSTPLTLLTWNVPLGTFAGTILPQPMLDAGITLATVDRHVTTVIGRIRPHVVCLQERHEFISALPEYVFVSTRADGYSSHLYVRRDIYHLIKEPRGDLPGAASCVLKWDGVDVLLCSYRSPPHKKTVTPIELHTAVVGVPKIIIAGDTNLYEKEQQFVELGFIDARLPLPRDRSNIWTIDKRINKYFVEDRRKEFYYRPDRVLLRGVACLRHQVVGTEPIFGKFYASDHFGVYVELRVDSDAPAGGAGRPP